MPHAALRRPRWALVLVLPSLAACPWCQPEDLNQLHPLAVVTPNPVEFGTCQVDADTSVAATLGNSGNAPMDVLRVAVEPAGSPFSVVEAPGKPLVQPVKQNESLPFQVVFHPVTRGPQDATLVVETTDEKNQRVEVPLHGVGGLPKIRVLPSAVNFDLVNQGAGSTRAVSVENIGLDTLHVTGVELTATSDPGFSLPPDAGFLGGEVAVGDTVSVTVRLDPVSSGAVEGELHLRSDADADADHAVPLGAHSNLAPDVKLVEKVSRLADVRSDLYLDVVVDGAGTADPEGESFTSMWRVLERPPGSQAVLEENGPQWERQLYIDTVGNYRVELSATDGRGAKGAAQVLIRAIRDLALRLTWQPKAGAPCQSATDVQHQCGRTDVDLHLVAPGGTLGDYFTGCNSQPGCSATCRPQASGAVCKGRGTDCSYANRNPDWGAAGDPGDDPRQDIDDVAGFGPENISLNNPVAGDYLVEVHFCADRLTDEGAVAQVEVFFHGQPADPPVLGPVDLEAQGNVWLAAIVHYDPAATPRFSLTPMTGVVTAGPEGLCTQ